MTVATKNVAIVPSVAPGYGMTELAKRVPQVHKSNAVAYTEASGAINLFELPGDSIITRMLIHVTTAFDASGSAAAATGTITVPNDTGTETMWDAANAGLQSTGFLPSTVNAVILPSSGGMVVFNYTTSTSGTSTNTKGQFEVYLEFVQKDSEL